MIRIYWFEKSILTYVYDCNLNELSQVSLWLRCSSQLHRSRKSNNISTIRATFISCRFIISLNAHRNILRVRYFDFGAHSIWMSSLSVEKILSTISLFSRFSDCKHDDNLTFVSFVKMNINGTAMSVSLKVVLSPINSCRKSLLKQSSVKCKPHR